MEDKKKMHGTWASRWTFVLAATGSAVGLGNIWKFPYITGENGGGAFVLVYLFCIALIGLPIMVAEVMLGRRGRLSPVNSMRLITTESGLHGFWNSIGWLGVLAGLIILSYYAVIAGWGLFYVLEMAGGSLHGTTAEQATMLFSRLQADPERLIRYQSIFMVMTVAVVAGGVTKGLGVAVRLLMPLLFVLLIILLVFGYREGDFQQGLNFLFNFNAGALTGKGVLEAMGHAFFTLSLGMGAIMAYGAYMSEHAKVGSTVLTVGVLDTIVALVAGMAIFPIVFANPVIEPGAGPGLLFISLPIAFGNMTGGLLFGSLFFVLVSVAAWSSAISLLEPAVAYLVESHSLKRLTANLLLGLIAWVVGLGTVFSFNIGADYKFAGFNFFEWLDFLSASIMLPLSGLLIALVVGWYMKPEVIREELADENPAVFAGWKVVLKFVSLVSVAVILGIGIYKTFPGFFQFPIFLFKGIYKAFA